MWKLKQTHIISCRDVYRPGNRVGVDGSPAQVWSHPTSPNWESARSWLLENEWRHSLTFDWDTKQKFHVHTYTMYYTFHSISYWVADVAERMKLQLMFQLSMLIATRCHHSVKRKISKVLREKKYVCYDEGCGIHSEVSYSFPCGQ